jgi:hypothetical protein
LQYSPRGLAGLRGILTTLFLENPVHAGVAPPDFLCITTYEKDQVFIRDCKRQGCRVFFAYCRKESAEANLSGNGSSES